MRRFILFTGLIAALILFTRWEAASVQAASVSQAAATANEALCLPGIYPTTPQDCLLAGPADYETRMAAQGLTFPEAPLPARAPAVELTYNLYRYARLKENENTPVYASAQDALNDQSPATYIEAGGLRYISYVDEAYLSGGEKPDAFMLRSGGWVAARNVMRRENAITLFQGLEFTRTPNHAFGWVRPFNPFIESKRTPGYGHDDLTGNKLPEYSVVQIYDMQSVDGTDWLMIGPDEWVERRQISQVIPDPTPPEGVTNGRWIEVNLEEQTLSVYEANRLVYATMIATGSDPFFTRPGIFQIYKKLETTPMSGSFEADRSDYYQLQDVPWTMYYDKARALHGAYWRTRFGFPQSHGCVNLSPGDSHWLFNWAVEGDWVYVWDPSGETPTDPAFYGDGGA